MKRTSAQIIDHISKQKKLKTVTYDQDELLCTYKTKTLTKAVFVIAELTREAFLRFIRIKNSLKADEIVVYCEYAYLACDNLTIVVNRED